MISFLLFLLSFDAHCEFSLLRFNLVMKRGCDSVMPTKTDSGLSSDNGRKGDGQVREDISAGTHPALSRVSEKDSREVRVGERASG